MQHIGRQSAPPLADGQEWVTPNRRPGDRIVVQVVPDDAPPLIREGLARRRVQAIEGECPCGGPLVWRDEYPDATFWRDESSASGGLKTDRLCAVHFRDCPAGDAVLVPALAAWAEERER